MYDDSGVTNRRKQKTERKEMFKWIKSVLKISYA